MERKGNNGAAAAANNKTSYEDFDPDFTWKIEKDKDTLELRAEGFKKEQLKVQVNSPGTILVDGERSLDDKKLKRIRFHKEFKLGNEHKSSGIRAKFGHGILHIVVPKVKDDSTPHHHHHPPQGTVPDKKGAEPITTRADNDPNPDHLRHRFGVVDRRRVVLVSILVTGAAAVGIAAYLSYKYWFLAGDDIRQTVPEVFPPP